MEDDERPGAERQPRKTRIVLTILLIAVVALAGFVMISSRIHMRAASPSAGGERAGPPPSQ